VKLLVLGRHLLHLPLSTQSVLSIALPYSADADDQTNTCDLSGHVRSRSGAQMHKVTIPLWSNMTDCTRGTSRNQDSRPYWLAASRSSRQTKCTAFPALLFGKYKIPSCPKPIPQPNCEAFTLWPITPNPEYHHEVCYCPHMHFLIHLDPR